MPKRFLLIAFLCCVLVGAFLLFLNWVFIAQQQLSYYEVESYRQNGLKALLLLLRQEKYQVTVSPQIPRDFSTFIILLSTGKISARERGRLLRWVQAGGSILELTSGQPGIYPGKKALANNSSYHLTFIPRGSLLKATFSGAAGVRYRPGGNPLWTRDSPERGYLGYRSDYFCYRNFYGKGRIISWNDLDGLTNLRIKGHPDNAVAFILLLAHLQASRQVRVLNFTQSAFHFRLDTSLASLFDRYGSALILILVVMGLSLWKIMVRFGRPKPLTLVRGRSYQEFLIAMADLFQRAGARQMVLENLWRSLWRVMIDITVLPWDSEADMIIGKLSAVTGKDYRILQTIYRQLTEGASVASQEALPFLETARKLNLYQRELTQWKISRTW